MAAKSILERVLIKINVCYLQHGRNVNKKRFLFIATLGLFFGSGINGFWSESKAFFSAYLRSPGGVGSIIPSSRFLSKAATRYIESNGHPIRILEIGAGTGCFTEKIVEKMGDDDWLDVIEIDPELCQVLQQKFGQYPSVQIHCLSILDWNPDLCYDFVVSALPHNTFDPDFVDSVLDKYKQLIKNNGILTYFELAGFSRIKRLFLMGQGKKKFLKIFNATSNFRKSFEFDKDLILFNAPPAWTYHLRIKKEI